jgi:uncharacterized membrane-anchored protein
MPEFYATIGAYVRTYATFSFAAKSAKAAPEAAIAKYKNDADDIMFDETDWDNVTMPSIVAIERASNGKIIVEGKDFSLNEDDARDWHAQELLNIVRLLAAKDADIRSLKKRSSIVLAKINAAFRAKPPDAPRPKAKGGAA